MLRKYLWSARTELAIDNLILPCDKFIWVSRPEQTHLCRGMYVSAPCCWTENRRSSLDPRLLKISEAWSQLGQGDGCLSSAQWHLSSLLSKDGFSPAFYLHAYKQLSVFWGKIQDKSLTNKYLKPFLFSNCKILTLFFRWISMQETPETCKS